MRLEHLFDYHAELGPMAMLGIGPAGRRCIFDVKGGAFAGRLNGELLASGGDWMTVDANGVAHLDVRATLRTTDGTLFYMQYYGILVTTPEIDQKIRSGQPVDFGETYFMTQPRFESGHPALSWLNAIVAVGEGRFGPGRVDFHVFEVANDRTRP